MGTPVRWGAETLVAATSTDIRQTDAITALSDGRFIVTWTNSPAGSSDDTVMARIFHADGSPAGAEFAVSPPTAAFQYDSDITALGGGGFVVTWTDTSHSGGDPTNNAIRGRLFDAAGTPVGPAFLINTTTADHQIDSSVAALADGRFVVTWQDDSHSPDDPSGSAVRGQVFNADGTLSGAEFLVNSATAGSQENADVAALSDGRFAVTWTSIVQVGPFTFVGSLHGQLFNGDGSKAGAEFEIRPPVPGFPYDSAITELSDGRFVVTWEDIAQAGDASGYGIFARIFNADGTVAGAQFLVNGTTAGTQYGGEVTALSDGRFIIAWSDASQSPDDPSGYAVRAQVFSADGSPSGAEFRLNSLTSGDQSRPLVTELADGRIAVSYESADLLGTAPYQTAIRAQIFDPREAAVDLTGTAAADTYYGTGFDDRLAGQEGADQLFGAGGNDRLFGGTGDDRLAGNAGDDALWGGNGNDRLLGGAGADALVGGGGDDRIFGGTGDDRLIGGPGSDIAWGGAGSDRFVFAPAHGTLRIADFQDGIDRLDLRAFGFASAAEVLALAQDAGGDTVITFAPGNVLVLDRIATGLLSDADFLL